MLRCDPGLAPGEPRSTHYGAATTFLIELGASLMVETYRGMVHPWECDAVDHFTTGYYYQAFEAASLRLLQILGCDEAALARLRPTACATRFTRELRAGDVYHVDSGVIEGAGAALVIGHRLYDSETGALCTAHRQAYAGDFAAPGDAPRLEWEEPARKQEIDFGALSKWAPTARTIMGTGGLGPHGVLGLDHLIHHSSDANVQFQNRVAMTSSYMREERIGYSTLGYDVRLGALPASAGAALETRTALAHAGRTSLWFAHRVTEARSGAWVADIAQFGVHLDMVARRPAELSPAIRAAAAKWLAGSAE
jgi:acyl-CoA thioesterase FadM